MLGAFIVFLIVLYLAFGKYGHIKLGDTKPEFSVLSWIAMMFTATAGSSLVFGVLLNGHIIIIHHPPLVSNQIVQKLLSGPLLTVYFIGDLWGL